MRNSSNTAFPSTVVWSTTWQQLFSTLCLNQSVHADTQYSAAIAKSIIVTLVLCREQHSSRGCSHKHPTDPQCLKDATATLWTWLGWWYLMVPPQLWVQIPSVITSTRLSSFLPSRSHSALKQQQLLCSVRHGQTGLPSLPHHETEGKGLYLAQALVKVFQHVQELNLCIALLASAACFLLLHSKVLKLLLVLLFVFISKY